MVLVNYFMFYISPKVIDQSLYLQLKAYRFSAKQKKSVYFVNVKSVALLLGLRVAQLQTDFRHIRFVEIYPVL